MPESETHCPSCFVQLEATPDVCPSCGHSFAVVVKGSLISARYEVLRQLGRGGMGLVYLARDRMLDTDVAIKVLRSDLRAGIERRFRSEIRLARQVRHRNVCGIHEYGEDGPLHYIVMEYIEGQDLRASVRRGHGLPPDEAFEVMIQAAEGLQAIHDAGIIHRDLKTANIMRDHRGQVRLMDFGIAKQAEGEGVERGVTGTGQLVGTPDYMSPEQIRGEKLDFRSDTYALGVVIFEVFTGRMPFHSATPVGIIMKHLEERPPLRGPEAARLPGPLVPVLERALAKDREARHPTASALAEDLRRARDACRGTEARPAITAPTERAVVLTPVPSITLPPPITQPGPPRAAVRLATRPGPSVPVVQPRVKPSGSPFQWLLIAVPLLVTLVTTVLLILLRTPGRNSERIGAGQAAEPVSSSPASLAAPPRALPTAAPARATQPAAAPSIAPVTLPLKAEAPARPSDPSASQIAARALVDQAQSALASAESSHALDLYEQAAAGFSKALELDPANAAARSGLAAAIRGEERARVMLAGATFVEGETEYRPAPQPAAPPGLGEAPPGFAIKPAEAPAPQARILIEVEPKQVKTGDEFQVRYSIYNTSAAPLLLSEASIQNVLGNRGATGGPIAPRSRTVAPGAKVVLAETRDVWKYDVATAWRTTLSVQLADGSTYTNTLRTRQ